MDIGEQLVAEIIDAIRSYRDVWVFDQMVEGEAHISFPTSTVRTMTAIFHSMWPAWLFNFERRDPGRNQSAPPCQPPYKPRNMIG